MIFTTTAFFSLLATAMASPPLEARATTATVFVRIEGPTKTIYEQTIVASSVSSITASGHTAVCNGSPKVAAGVTSLEVLAQTGQFFEADFNGTTFGFVTKINGTTNSAAAQWGTIINNAPNGGGIILQGVDDGTNTEYQDFCFTTLPNDQHMLYAYFGDIDDTNFLFMSGPATAKVGQTAQCGYSYFLDYFRSLLPSDTVPFVEEGAYVNDLSQDNASGARVDATFPAGSSSSSTASVSITFHAAGTYNMKAHCPTGSACVRSNHVVTVVS
ncbi:hypothetical protein GGX14DRAFT_485142 [Mycena pura]|uniref:Uncharacterized protein n=1 Tax=Mycena pura TaxID=153505 RepID=A0AAD6UK33_9AGAR|nr:hypothetical protein GGX14DRAFT_485142 [Mycena pura]